MSRLMHRTCDTALAETERALREAQDRAYRLGERIVIETQRADKRQELMERASDAALDQRLTHHAEREQLRSELAAAADREAALARELADLRARDGVLESRRRRVAEKALGGAWAGPGREASGSRAQVAQALLALPLASFDVTVTYERDQWCDWRWMVDGDSVDTNTGFAPTSQEEVLQHRYGFTLLELAQIHRDAENAHRQMQALTSEEF